MRVSNINARDIPEAWWLCIREVFNHGRDYKIDRGSYAGQYRRELDFVVVWIANPGTRPLIPDVPEGLPAPTSAKYIESDYLISLMTPNSGFNQEYSYGNDVYHQFDEVCRMYKNSGFNTNQACMTIGDPHSIYLGSPQCLKVIDTRVQDGKLNFFVYFRSWDLFTGFPANLAGIQLMKEMMAEEIGAKDGEIIAISKGLHLYEHHWLLGKAVVGL